MTEVRVTPPKITPAQARMLRICGSSRESFDWGDVTAWAVRAAPNAEIAWRNVVRVGDALCAKGLITTGPCEPHGEVTELGRAWLAQDAEPE